MSIILQECKNLIKQMLYKSNNYKSNNFILNIEEPFIHIDNTDLYIDIDLQIWKKFDIGFDIISSLEDKSDRLKVILAILLKSTSPYIEYDIDKDSLFNYYISLLNKYKIKYIIKYKLLLNYEYENINTLITSDPKTLFYLPTKNDRGLESLYICELKINDIVIIYGDPYKIVSIEEERL